MSLWIPQTQSRSAWSWILQCRPLQSHTCRDTRVDARGHAQPCSAGAQRWGSGLSYPCLGGAGIHRLLTYGKLMGLALTPYGCCDGLRRCSMQRLGTEPGMQGALRKW